MMKGVFVVEKLIGLQAFELILHCFTLPWKWLYFP